MVKRGKKALLKRGKEAPLKRRKEVLLGIKIISILSYIFAAFLLIAGFGMIIAIFTGISLLNLIDIQQIVGQIELTDAAAASIIFVIILIAGISMILFGVFYFFVARGLWKLKNWARIAAIVLAALQFVTAFTPWSPLQLIISSVILWYLIFSKEVKAAFK